MLLTMRKGRGEGREEVFCTSFASNLFVALWRLDLWCMQLRGAFWQGRGAVSDPSATIVIGSILPGVGGVD